MGANYLLKENDLHRLIRLFNIVRKKKVGILIGIGLGLVTCLFTPMLISLLYTQAIYWITHVLNGKLEVPLTIVLLVLLMVMAAFVMFGLRGLIAYVFRGKKFQKK